MTHNKENAIVSVRCHLRIFFRTNNLQDSRYSLLISFLIVDRKRLVIISLSIRILTNLKWIHGKILFLLRLLMIILEIFLK